MNDYEKQQILPYTLYEPCFAIKENRFYYRHLSTQQKKKKENN